MKLNKLQKTQEQYAAHRKLSKDDYATLEIEKSEGRIRITDADFQRYRTPVEMVEHLMWVAEMIREGFDE